MNILIVTNAPLVIFWSSSFFYLFSLLDLVNGPSSVKTSLDVECSNLNQWFEYQTNYSGFLIIELNMWPKMASEYRTRTTGASCSVVRSWPWSEYRTLKILNFGTQITLPALWLVCREISKSVFRAFIFCATS